MALLKAAVSWQPCCSSSEDYLVLRLDQQICSLWKFEMQEGQETPTETLIFCLDGDSLRRAHWVHGTSLNCFDVIHTNLSPLWVGATCLHKFPHPQLWICSWDPLVHLCAELVGASLTGAAILHWRVSSCGKQSCNHSWGSNRAPICLKRRKAFHMKL